MKNYNRYLRQNNFSESRGARPNGDFFYSKELFFQINQLLSVLYKKDSGHLFLIFPCPANVVLQSWSSFPQVKDLLNFSTHSLGIGLGWSIFAVSRNLAEKLPPVFVGGGMVSQVDDSAFSVKDDLGEKFWAGTIPTAQLILLRDHLQGVVSGS